MTSSRAVHSTARTNLPPPSKLSFLARSWILPRRSARFFPKAIAARRVGGLLAAGAGAGGEARQGRAAVSPDVRGQATPRSREGRRSLEPRCERVPPMLNPVAYWL